MSEATRRRTERRRTYARRRLLAACGVLLVIAGIALLLTNLGGGGEAGSSRAFRSGLTRSQEQARGLSAALGRALTGARSQSDREIGAQFVRLADRAKGVSRSMAALRPPARLRADVRRMTRAMGTVAADLGRIATAASRHDGVRARSAFRALLADARAFRRAENAVTARAV